MEVIDIKKAKTIKNPHGVKVSRIYDGDHAQAMHITLQPGESLKKHVTPVDVFFYVLEGRGVVEIGDEKEMVEQDMLVNSPAKIPHCLHNTSSSIFRILVVKTQKLDV